MLAQGRHWIVKWIFTMSRQAFPGATTLERMAKLLSDYRLPKNVHGFKCWYCDARLIEDGAKLAFIGVNPTGDQHDAAHDKKERYLDAPMRKGTRCGTLGWMRSGPTGIRIIRIKKGSIGFSRKCAAPDGNRSFDPRPVLTCAPFGLSSPGICRPSFGVPAWSGLERP